MDNYLESSQLFQQLPFSLILMRTNDLICFQQLEQNFRFGSKLPDMSAMSVRIEMGLARNESCVFEDHRFYFTSL